METQSGQNEIYSTHKLFTFEPNPTNNVVNLNFTDNLSNYYLITIMDKLGKVIKTDQIKSSIGLNKYSYNLENLMKGVYFITIKSSNNVSTFKVVLM